MSNWKYRSLEWIHKIREENYQKTKKIPLKQLMEESKGETKKFISKIESKKGATRWER